MTTGQSGCGYIRWCGWSVLMGRKRRKISLHHELTMNITEQQLISITNWWIIPRRRLILAAILTKFVGRRHTKTAVTWLWREWLSDSFTHSFTPVSCTVGYLDVLRVAKLLLIVVDEKMQKLLTCRKLGTPTGPPTIAEYRVDLSASIYLLNYKSQLCQFWACYSWPWLGPPLVALRCVILPVSWMMSCFHIKVRNRRRDKDVQLKVRQQRTAWIWLSNKY